MVFLAEFWHMFPGSTSNNSLYKKTVVTFILWCSKQWDCNDDSNCVYFCF